MLSSHRKRLERHWGWLGFLIAVIVCSQHACAADAVDPSTFAFGDGRIDRDALKQAIANTCAELVKDDQNETVVRHLRIEVFERSHVTTHAQVTLFALCESHWYQTIEGTRPLNLVTVEYVLLDANGKAVSKNAWKVIYTANAKTDGVHWTREAKMGPNAAEFYGALPKWAKTQLCWTSGFLDQNPGVAIVDWAKTPDEVAAGFLADAIGVVPVSGLKPIADVLVSLMKKVTSDTLKEAVKNKELRWGYGAQITNERALKSRKVYEKIGQRMWEGS